MPQLFDIKILDIIKKRYTKCHQKCIFIETANKLELMDFDQPHETI